MPSQPNIKKIAKREAKKEVQKHSKVDYKKEKPLRNGLKKLKNITKKESQEIKQLKKALNKLSQRSNVSIPNRLYLANLFMPTSFMSRGRNAAAFQATATASFKGSVPLDTSAKFNWIRIIPNAFFNTAVGQAALVTQSTSEDGTTWPTDATTIAQPPSLLNSAVEGRITAFEAVIVVEGNAFTQQGEMICCPLTSVNTIIVGQFSNLLNQPYCIAGTMYPNQAIVAHQFPQNAQSQETFQTGAMQWNDIVLSANNCAVGSALRIEWFMHVEYTPTVAVRNLVNLDVSRVDALVSSEIASAVGSYPALVCAYKQEYNIAVKAITKGLRPNGGVGGNVGNLHSGFTGKAHGPISHKYEPVGMPSDDIEGNDSYTHTVFNAIKNKTDEFLCESGLPGCSTANNGARILNNVAQVGAEMATKAMINKIMSHSGVNTGRLGLGN